jgi:hypothetical protein
MLHVIGGPVQGFNWNEYEQKLLILARHNIDNSYCPVIFRVSQPRRLPNGYIRSGKGCHWSWQSWMKQNLKGWSK